MISEWAVRDKRPLETMSETSCHRELTPCPRNEPAIAWLQIRCSTYWANRSDNVKCHRVLKPNRICLIVPFFILRMCQNRCLHVQLINKTYIINLHIYLEILEFSEIFFSDTYILKSNCEICFCSHYKNEYSNFIRRWFLINSIWQYNTSLWTCWLFLLLL